MTIKELPMKYMLISLVALLSSCTYSITMTHAEGSASDVVDEGQTPTASLIPTLSVTPKAL